MAEWIQWLLEETNNNQIINWILKTQKVSLAKNLLTGEERVTFALSVLSSRKKVNSIFQSPYVNARLAIAATAGIMVSDFVCRIKENKQVLNGDLLLITRQIGIGVSQLNEVYLDGQYLSNLWEITTGNIAKPNVKFGRPRLIVSAPRPGLLARAGIVADTIVIDATHPLTLERIKEILADPIVACSKQIVIVIPLGYHHEIFKDAKPTWVWDFQATQAARQQWKTPLTHISAPERWTRKYLVCNDEKTNNLLSIARTKLSLLSKNSSNVPPPLQLLQAWGIYNQLASLCVQLGTYEEMAFRHNYARPIHEKIKHLEDHSELIQPINESKYLWASEWRPLLESLSAAYENLKGDEPSKFWPIALLVDEFISKNFPSPLLIICPTHIEGNLLIKTLASVNSRLYEYLQPDGLTIATPKALAGLSKEHTQRIVLSGPLSARWRYLNATMSASDIVVYPHEISIDEHILETQVEKVINSSSLQNRSAFLYHLGLNPRTEINASFPTVSPEVGNYINIETVTDDAIPKRYPYTKQDIDLEKLSSPDWAWDAEDLTYVPPLQGNASYTGRYKIFSDETEVQGPKVVIILDGGEEIVVPYGQVFDVYRPITEEVDEQAAEAIETGDVLILVQDSNYYRLFDRIIEALESHPNYALMSVWLKLWDIIKQEILSDCQNDISILHQKLTQRGVEITEQAVRGWYSGIMAPRDENIIYLMLEFSSNKSGASNKSKIREALGHIRGMRRAAGRRVHDLIKQTAISKKPESLTDAIDIALEDVMAACTTRRVQAVKHLN